MGNLKISKYSEALVSFQFQSEQHYEWGMVLPTLKIQISSLTPEQLH